MSWEKTAYTDAGAALLAASVNGSALTITQAVAATGTTEDDLSTITALNGDAHDLSLLGVETVVTSDNKPARKVTIRIKGDGPEGYILHQIGVYGKLAGDTEDTLLFVMQDEHGTEIPAADKEFELEITVILAISNNASLAVEVDPQISSLMRLLIAAVDAYTKAQTDQRIRDDIEVHNTAADAHPQLRSDLAALRTSVNALELKFMTNITKNPFSVTFSDLSGLTVTGVWNADLQRLEF